MLSLLTRCCCRGLVYLWVLPTSSLGLTLLLPTLLTGGRAKWVGGVLEIHGGLAAWLLRRCVPLPGGARAMTLGHVVLAVSQADHEWTRPHERVHVCQCERWGPLFVPAYLLASLWLMLWGRSAYEDNPFEKEAYARDGRGKRRP